MVKKFHLFHDGKNFRLMEMSAGSPVRLQSARGEVSRSKHLHILLRSIENLILGKLKWDGISVSTKPPPCGVSSGCRALADKELLAWERFRSYLEAD